MKKMKVRVTLLLCMGVLAVALSGCSGDKKEAASKSDNDTLTKPTKGGSIVVGIPQDLETSLDPHIAVAAGTEEVLFNIFEGLVKPDEAGNLVEAVASSYEISDDGKVYAFTLREGVKFHNGAEVTAKDVKYTIDRCANTLSGEPLVLAYSIIEDVHIVDERVVEVHLSEANPEFLAYMTTAIVPEGYENEGGVPIGTGPFRYVSRSLQENIVLERFEEYWREGAYLDKVEFKVVANADMVVTSLKAGTIDMYSRLTSSQAKELKEGFRIEEGTMNLVQALYLNNDAKVFSDVRVRQALSYCIDPEEIMEITADGQGTRVGSAMFPAFEKYYDDELSKRYIKDVGKSKALLKEAGYPDGFQMSITVPSNYQPHLDAAQVMIEQLKAIGVKATIKPVEWDSWLSEVYMERNYEATVIGLDASALTGRAMLGRFASEANNNFINYHSEQYDALFSKVLATGDEAEQIILYKEMADLLSKDAASVFIQDMANLVALNLAYDGYTFYPVYVTDMSKVYKVES